MNWQRLGDLLTVRRSGMADTMHLARWRHARDIRALILLFIKDLLNFVLL